MKREWDFDVREDATGFHVIISQRGGVYPSYLHRSCGTRRELIDVVRSCSISIDVHAVDEYGRTALYVVCEKGYHEIAELLLDMGASINYQFRRRDGTYPACMGNTALHIATRNGMLDTVKLLLSRGAEVDVLSFFNRTPLHAAVKCGHCDIVAELLDYGADVSKYSDTAGETALQKAAEIGSAELCDLLLRRNADVHAVNSNGGTALHYSSPEVTELLLRNGALPSARNKAGTTPLHFAAYRDHAEKVGLLLNWGADIHSTSNDGLTALHYACQGKSPIAAEHLLKMGARIDEVAAESQGRTPLHLAALAEHSGRETLSNYIKLLKLLFQWGADVNVRDESGGTALSLALESITGLIQYESAAPEIFTKHLVTMQAQGLHVSEINLLALYDHPLTRDLRQTCESELQSMRGMKIGHSKVTFFDLLTKGPLRLADYAANKDIVRVLKSEEFETDFPTFAADIRQKFNQGRQRLRLQKQSDSVLRLGILRSVPYPVIRSLDRYLSNEDLKRIIKAKE